MISTGFQIFTSTQPVLCFCVFAGKNVVYLANQSCKDGKSKALCHKPKLCATSKALCHNQKQTTQEFGTQPNNALCLCREKRCLFGKSKLQRRQKQSSVPQPKANYPRIRHQPNNAFVSLQGKTLFIWQIKVAKTAKAKLCATTQALCYNQKHKSKALCHKPKLCATNPSSVAQTQALWHKPKLCGTNPSSVPQPKANYPRIRHSRITLCVFAGKNAVYLANQSCKDGKSKALCYGK